jgi:5-methylcytosine-specific restriction endonuclease McrA
MPTGVYERTPSMIANMCKAAQKVWDERTPDQLVEISRDKSRIMLDIMNSPEVKGRESRSQTRRFEDSEEHRKLSMAHQRSYQEDPTLADRIGHSVSKTCKNPEVSSRKSRASREVWSDPELRLEQSKTMEKITNTPEARGRNSRNQTKVWAEYTSEEREARLRSASEAQLDSYKKDPTRARRLSKSLGVAMRKYWDSLSSEEYKLKCGENNPAWRGGSVRDYGYGWSAIAECIIIRDGCLCQLCGTKKNLAVHHIDYDTLNVEDTNLITLCRCCNGHVNGDREYWRDYFRKLLENQTRVGARKEEED